MMSFTVRCDFNALLYFMEHCRYVPLQSRAILTQDCILWNTTEWLFHNLYYGECELAPQIVSSGHKP